MTNIEEQAHEMALNMLINGDVKQCRNCKQVKPLEDFYKSSRNYSKTVCKDCYNEKRKVQRKSYGDTPILAVADREYQEADLTLHNYKEPLTKVPDGFGYMGTITSTNDGNYIQCHICGRLYANMGGHLYAAHKMTAREYKDMFGLKYTSALISENERMRLKKKSLDWLKKLTDEEKEAYIAKHKEAYYEKGRAKRAKTGQPKEKLEQKNEKGSCPDQVLAKIRQVADEMGRTPSKAEFIAHLGSQRFVHLAYKLFGSWTLAVELAGLTPKSKELSKDYKRYDDGELLSSLRDFALQNGVEPTKSDFNRGVLPPYPLYVERFGSLPKAYIEAELSDILEGQIGGAF